jgi:Fic family protein
MILNEDDLKLIVLQCEHQRDTSPEAVAGFTAAYADAKLTRINELDTVARIMSKIKEWGRLIKPKENHYGWRNVNVFVRFNETPSPQIVPRMMEHYCDEYWRYVFFQGDRSNVYWKTADQLYRDFEEIHPFIDGNGRVGHLLWAIAKRELEGEWPMTLPPDFWSIQ